MTPLKGIINFGPVTLQEFEAMGITTLEQLQELGWEETCRRYVQYFPERLNANAFFGVIAALQGVAWNKLSLAKRADANRLVSELREQLGLPKVKKAARRKTSTRR